MADSETREAQMESDQEHQESREENTESGALGDVLKTMMEKMEDIYQTINRAEMTTFNRELMRRLEEKNAAPSYPVQAEADGAQLPERTENRSCHYCHRRGHIKKNCADNPRRGRRGGRGGSRGGGKRDRNSLDLDANEKEMGIKLYKEALKQVKIEIDSEQSSQSRMSALTTKFVFIIDQLANLMHGVNKLEEAVEYYKQTLQALISHGTSREDDAVIEISLKLASIYAEQGRHKLSETGFSWCVETARKKVNETEKLNMNSSVLLGICLESYGKYLLSRKNAYKAVTLFSEALVIARKFFGEKHEQVALLLNNLGVAYFETGQLELSKTFFSEAINLSTEEKYGDLWSFHLNLGNVLNQTGDIEEAKREYKQALEHCQSETIKHDITDQLLKLS